MVRPLRRRAAQVMHGDAARAGRYEEAAGPVAAAVRETEVVGAPVGCVVPVEDAEVVDRGSEVVVVGVVRRDGDGVRTGPAELVGRAEPVGPALTGLAGTPPTVATGGGLTRT
jgi:hypothetical protein